MKKIYWKMLISGNIEFINLTFWSHGLVISDITDLSNDNSRLFKLFKKSVVQYHLLRFSYSFQPCYLFLKVKQRQSFFCTEKSVVIEIIFFSKQDIGWFHTSLCLTTSSFSFSSVFWFLTSSIACLISELSERTGFNLLH